MITRKVWELAKSNDHNLIRTYLGIASEFEDVPDKLARRLHMDGEPVLVCEHMDHSERMFEIKCKFKGTLGTLYCNMASIWDIQNWVETYFEEPAVLLEAIDIEKDNFTGLTFEDPDLNVSLLTIKNVGIISDLTAD